MLHAYRQMVDAARKHNMPERYESDLFVVDRAACESGNVSRQFAWVLRKNGTHMVEFRQQASDTLLNWVMREVDSGEAKCFWFDGEWLERITYAEFKDKCKRLPTVPSKPTKADTDRAVRFHNLCERLRILEAARNGRDMENLTFTEVASSSKGFESYRVQLPWTHYPVRPRPDGLTDD